MFVESGTQNCYCFFPKVFPCPFDRPFAFADGQACCKFYRPKPGNPECQGSELNVNHGMDCCINDDFLPCPTNLFPCMDHVDSASMNVLYF